MIEKNPGGSSAGSGLPIYNPNDPIHQQDSLDTAPRPQAPAAKPAASVKPPTGSTSKPSSKSSSSTTTSRSSGASRSEAPAASSAGRPKGISDADWALVTQIASQYNIDPNVLVAIGMHETGWGTKGLGRSGLVLGVGAYDSGPSYQWSGLQAQLTEGAKLLSSWGVHTIQDIAAGKAGKWATDPRWEAGVVSMYNQLTGGKVQVPQGGGGSLTGANGLSPSGATGNPNVTLSASELATNYGWAQAVLNSDPELKNLFSEAVAGQWTAQRFSAALNNTKWFQTHASSWRTAEAERLSDPASWANRTAQAKAQIQQTAEQLGAQLNDGELNQVADNYLHGGWSQSFLQKTLAQYVTVQKNGSFGGQAGDMESQLRQYAMDNGVRVADSWIANGVRGVLGGTTDMNTLQNNLRQYALSAFPTLADQIKAGQSVKDIASPYIQTMGQILELDPNKIDLFDPTIRSALSSAGPDGKPTTKSLYQFENDLRNDPRWMQTNNARETLSGITSKILGDWGLISG